MNFNLRIKEICEKPRLFGVSSSEDIYWIILGYFSIEKKHVSYKDSSEDFLVSFENYLFKDYPNNFGRDWGIFFRLISKNNSDSIMKFKEKFDSFVLELKFEFKTCPNPSVRDSLFQSLIKNSIVEYNIYNLLQLDKFLLGIDIAYAEYNFNDFEFYSTYKRKITENGEFVLKFFELPLYLNVVQQVYARFYPNEIKALDYYLDVIILGNVDNVGRW